MNYIELIENAVESIRLDSKGDLRWRYYKGKNDLPYAPRGVNDEYMDLREQAALPLIRLAVKVPVQRLRMGGVRNGVSEPTDERTWRMLKKNKIHSKSKVWFTHALALGYGVASVWPGDDGEPVINVEDPSKLHIVYRFDDPTAIQHVVKTWAEDEDTQIAMLYIGDKVYRFEAAANSSDWRLVEEFDNPIGRPPFVLFAPDRDADGTCNSVIDSLIPIQRSIDTLRFDSLLAAQYAAYRQRIITGFDPVLRDLNGNVVYATDEDGNQLVDDEGNPIPVMGPTPKLGVDRMIAFPGEGTKIFDLEESNLQNYEYPIHSQIAAFSSAAQIPPQYLIPDFKNVSGDLLVATEASLRGYLASLQEVMGDAMSELLEMCNEIVDEPYATQIVWQDADPKDIATIADAASKMVPNGAPIEMFLNMFPGADMQQVQEWKRQGENALQKSLENDLRNMGQF